VKLRALLLAACLSAPCHQAQAVDLEAAIGRSAFCCLQDGVWWQSPFGFNGDTRVASWELGARQRFGHWGMHAAYSDLGTVKGDNLATMRDADFNNFNTTANCNQATQHNCLGYFRTRQHVKGVMAGGSYQFTVKGFGIEPEAGKFFYRSDFEVAIWCPTCGTFPTGEQRDERSMSGIRRSTYLALKVSKGNVFLSIRRFSNIDGSGDISKGEFATGLTSGPVNQIMLGVTL